MNPLHIDTPDAHLARRKAMLETHGPEVRKLMGPFWGTAVIALLIVSTQVVAAKFASGLSIGWLIALAFFFGAFLNHALYVIIHDATHSLVFRKLAGNKLVLLLCDIPLLAPGAMAFQKYHLLHHSYLGEVDADADLVSDTEAKLVGNSSLKKAIWFLFLGVSQAMRPSRITRIKLLDGWVLLNFFTQLVAVFCISQFAGLAGLLYLLLSSIFGLGLHPLGGRWIAEHFVTHEKQETYSYYGPLNWVILNVGFHVEHHDFMNIAWPNLPKLKATAPEYYSNLASYDSYSKLVAKFILDPDLSLLSRITRNPKKMVS